MRSPVNGAAVHLCGHRSSASNIGALDFSLAEFARQRLEEPCPDQIPDARYERLHEAGIIRSQAVPRWRSSG
jgi:hypothetical protein